MYIDLFQLFGCVEEIDEDGNNTIWLMHEHHAGEESDNMLLFVMNHELMTL